MSRSSRRRTQAAAFPNLPSGVQTGLTRLVSDNAETVAAMLNQKDKADDVAALCEACAGVMKQQQLSPASFLARFFDTKVLSEHAVLLQKSGKGSAPTLAERIGAEWAKNKKGMLETKGAAAESPQEEATSKRTKEEDSTGEAQIPPKKKKKRNKDEQADAAAATKTKTKKKSECDD